MAGIFIFLLVLVLGVIISVLSFGVYVLNRLLGGFSATRRFISRLFGWDRVANEGWRPTGSRQTAQSRDSEGSARRDDRCEEADGDTNNDVSHTNEKIFSPNEGEYVDFEEIR